MAGAGSTAVGPAGVWEVGQGVHSQNIVDQTLRLRTQHLTSKKRDMIGRKFVAAVVRAWGASQCRIAAAADGRGSSPCPCPYH